MDILDLILKDTKLKHLVFVATYRDNELNNNTHLMNWMNNLHGYDNNLCIRKLEIGQKDLNLGKLKLKLHMHQ